MSSNAEPSTVTRLVERSDTHTAPHRVTTWEAIRSSRWVSMALLAVAQMGATYARSLLNPLQETLGQAWSLSDQQIAFLQGPVLAIPMLVIAVPLGLMIDRRSRMRLLVVLWTVMLAGSLATVFAPGFISLAVARAAVGVAAFAINPVIVSLLADMFQPAARGRAFTVIGVSQFAGLSSVFALCGVLLEHGLATAGAWQHVAFWLVLPLMLPLPLLAILREPARLEVRVENATPKRSLLELWSLRRELGPLLTAIFMMEISLGAVLVWAGPVLARAQDLSPGAVGALMASALAISGIAGPIAGGLLADFCIRRFRASGAQIVLAVVLGASAPLGLFGMIYMPIIAGSMLVALVTMTIAAVVMGTTLLTVVVPNELRGLCMSVVAASSILFGFAFAPVLVSTLGSLSSRTDGLAMALSATATLTALIGTIVLLAQFRMSTRQRNGPAI